MNKSKTADNQDFIVIDLQLFADENLDENGQARLTEDGKLASDNSQAEKAPVSTRDMISRIYDEAATGDKSKEENPQQNSESENSKADTEKNPASVLSEQIVQAIDEIKKINPVAAEKYNNPEAIAKTIISQEKTLTNTFQENARLKQALETLTAEIDSLKQSKPSGNNQPIEPGENSSEPAVLDTEEYMNQFYEKPQEVIAKTVESVVKKLIAPLESRVNPVVEMVEAQKMQELWDSATRDFYKNNPDMVDFKDGMKQYIQENNLLNSNNPEKVLRDALTYAKGLSYQPPQTIDPKTFLADENFVNENILNNEEIVNKVLQKHMQAIKDGTQSVAAISGQGSGRAIAMPPSEPKNLNDAHKLLRERLSGT
jgi:soluble cytochrome b562